MQDKNILINSMNNLINHISISRKNQQQMFVSLTRNDFEKIITNLEDSLLKLRITTVQLLTQLLYNNLLLKQKFCELMNINFSHNSNIVLNNNIKKILQKHQKKEKDLYMLLKSHAKVSQENLSLQGFGGQPPLLWFINPKNQRLSVQYIYRQQISNTLSSLSSNINQVLNFDPIECIFGITIIQFELNHSVQARVPTSSSITTQSSKVRSNIKANNHNVSRQSNGSSTPRHGINQHYLPTSTKNSTFQKSNKTTNFSFTYQPYAQSRGVNNQRPGKNQQPLLNSSLDLNIRRNRNMQYSLNSPINYDYQFDNKSKKQNEQKYLLVENDKFNRLSLQLNELKSQKRNYTIEAQINANINEYSNIKHIPTLSNQHHHGIKLTTPRYSMMNAKKISIVNNSFTNGCQTDRMKTQKVQSFIQRDKLPNESYTPINIQKIKTIQLGRGTRGPQTIRDKKNIKIERH